MSPEAKAEMQMHVLDGMADAWVAEVDLTSMIKAATSPMNLNKNAPADVKEKFRLRMEAQIDAIARQAFVEGAHRGACMVQDAYNPIVTEQRARIDALEEQLTGRDAALNEIEGCFQAAFVEGLAERLAELDNDTGGIRDLVERRLMPAQTAAIRTRSEQEGK